MTETLSIVSGVVTILQHSRKTVKIVPKTIRDGQSEKRKKLLETAQNPEQTILKLDKL